jgi:Kdo2-lipid IVA lauroyltransferase/acyltransferase
VDSPLAQFSFAKRLQFRLEYAAVRLVAALLSNLSTEAASNVSGALWRFFAPALGRHRRAHLYLAQAMPDLSKEERERILRAMWENLGRTFGEFFHLRRMAEEGRFTLENPEGFADFNRQRRFVVCTLHMGNWEVLGPCARQQGLEFATIYKALSNPLVDRFVYALRAPHYPGGLLPKTVQTARRMLKHAQREGPIAVLADQRDGRGVRAEFFGRPAPSTPFPAYVARSLGLPLYAVRVLRLPRSRFSLRAVPISVPTTDDSEADVRAATTAVQAQFEAFIREAPEQWMWAHNRWG